MGLTTPAGPSNVLYLTVAGGNMVEKSTEDNPLARARKYEDREGNTKTKYEIIHRGLTGIITDVSLERSDFGERLVITVRNGDDTAKLTLATKSDYFTDFAKKVPNIDFSKEVIISPWEMDVEGKSRKRRGVSIKQSGEKVQNFYYDPDKKENINGFPKVDNEELEDLGREDYWEKYWGEVGRFLKRKIKNLTIGEIKSGDSEPQQQEAPVSISEDDDDLPF